jgi:hypothetical protein
MKIYLKSSLDPRLSEDEFYQGMSSLSWNTPGYVDTSDKNHPWLGQKVRIDFSVDPNNSIYPAKQTLFITKCDYPCINLSRTLEDYGNFIRINSDRDFEIFKQIRNQLGSYFQ